jgi:hypothetical protein
MKNARGAAARVGFTRRTRVVWTSEAVVVIEFLAALQSRPREHRASRRGARGGDDVRDAPVLGHDARGGTFRDAPPSDVRSAFRSTVARA